MLIDNTSDLIQFKLNGAITTNQLPFVASYNNFTATTVTPVKNTGQSNSTSAVNIVPSPASGEQNQLRFFSIYNADTVSATVIVQVYDGSNTRIIYQAVLAVGDELFYDDGKGFFIQTASGSEKVQGLRIIENGMNLAPGFMAAGTATSVALTNATGQAQYLGRADKAYTTMTFAYNVSTALGATIAWAELLVYTSPPGIMGKAQNFTLRGFTDCSGIWNTNTKKITAVTVSNINPGDDIWVSFSFST